MSLLINFKDAVNASGLDPNATEAVYYMDGKFANEAEVRARCPHARLHAITTQGANGLHIFALDCETGNLGTTSSELLIVKAVAWVEEQIRLEADPIVVYANQNLWLVLGLLEALARFGSRIERWDADFDGKPEIPAWASAKQYADGRVDLDIARAAFFGDHAGGVARIEATYDLGSGHWTARNQAARVQLAQRDQWASVELQYNRHTGHIRLRPLPFDAKPLG